MNENGILNNIWEELSTNNLTESDFDAWKDNFLKDQSVQSNVYSYLVENNLTKSNGEDWVKNINVELAAEQTKAEEKPMTKGEIRSTTLEALPGPFQGVASMAKGAGYLSTVGSAIKELFTDPEERQETKEVISAVGSEVKRRSKNLLNKLPATFAQFYKSIGFDDLYDPKELEYLKAQDPNATYVDPMGDPTGFKTNADRIKYLEGYKSSSAGLAEKEVDDFIVKKMKLAEISDKYLSKDTGEGIVKGIKQGDASDIIGGIFNAGASMVETVVPAMLTGGMSIPFQITAPMITDYNQRKAEAIYGEDDPDAVRKLFENGQEELAIPATLGVVASTAEYAGFKGVSSYLLGKAAKNTFAKLMLTGNKEGLTELFQSGIDEVNTASAEGKDGLDLAKAFIDGIASEKGLESYLQGFIGGTGMSAGGRAINRALRSDNASVKDVNDKINNLSSLNYAKNKTRNKDVKEALNVEIKAAEQDLKNYINEKRKLNKVLTAEEKTSLVNILNQKDSIKEKIESFKAQLKNKEIDNKEFGYAIRSLNNQDKKLSDQLNEIQAAATTRAAEKVTETVKEQIKEAGLEGEVTEMTSEEISNIKEEGFDSKAAAEQFGYIDQGTDGSFRIVLNKDKPMVGTAAHEFMHAVLFKTIKQNKDTQDSLGDALIEHVSKLGGDKSILGKRLQAYGKYNKDGVFERDANFGEETITIMSEEIVNGNLKFNENFFTKIGDVVRRFFQNTLADTRFGKEIKFDNARDVYNFVKDYSKSIKDGKINKAILKVAKKGAKGKLVKETKAKVKPTKQMSKVYQEVEAMKPDLTSTDPTAKRNAALIAANTLENEVDRRLPKLENVGKEAREDIVRDFLFSEGRGLTGLLTKYDPNINESVMGYLNSFVPGTKMSLLDARLQEFYKDDPRFGNIVQSMEQEGVTEKVEQQAVEEVATETKVKRKTKKIILSDRLGVKNKVDKAVKEKLSELDIDNLTFKTLKDQAPDITGEMFGISPKKLISGANITKKELQSAQMFINKNADVLISMLPEGATASGTATGVPQTLLKAFYTKTDRAKMAKTGTKAGLAIQQKNKINKTEFLETFGIIDGKPVRTDRNTSARVLALANQAGKIMTNQAVREQLLDQGKPIQAIQHIGDGKSTVMFSKSLRDISIDQQVIFWDGLSEVGAKTNPSLKNILDKKNIKNILKEVYSDKIKDSDLGKIANDMVGYLKLYQPVVSKNKTQDEAQWTEFIANSFAEEANNIIKMLNLEIDGKKVKFAGDLYDNISNVQQGRRIFVDAGNMLLKKYGPEKGAKMVNMLKGMYAKNAKVGRGMFKTDLTNSKNPKVVPVKLKKGEEFGRGRNQLFESVAAFNAYVDQIQGKNDKETKLFKEAYKNQKPLYGQTSASAVKDVDYKGRLKEAQEARQLIDDVMSMLDNDLDIAMFMISNISSMTTPLRRAANLEYISDLVLDMDIKNLGKLAEYEHMIPANQMALRIIDAYKNKGGIKKLNDFYKNYNVAIIPKTMDNVLKKQGLQSKMLAGHNFETDPSWTRYYNFLTNEFNDIVSIRNINTNKLIGPRFKFSKDIKSTKTLNKAIQFSRSTNESKGITVLDFDDTLATTESLVKFTTPDGTTGTLNAEEYASTYEDLLGQGYTFDFSDFNKVVKGKIAPLFQKAIKLQGKFGPENMFVLTARPPAAQKAIFDFLKANGLNIPIKNITGLANSTAEAKALWIADKVGEGYNDFYFADDALQNVQAVDNMLNQFDVKRKVQQAKVKFSKDINTDFNNILEDVTGIESIKRFAATKARKRGADKGKFRFFIPPSHEDFVGLLYNFMGKGRKGDGHRNFFEKALVRPLNRANREYDTARQSIANDYKALNKQFPDVKKKLTKKTPDGDFTFQDAIRVYLWDKHGHSIPGLSEIDQANLSELVMADASLQAYAETLNIISKQDTYINPTDGWESGDIRVDLDDATGRVGRDEYFAEFNENADIVFSEENLNKIEAGFGNGVREALEDMLYRIKTGRNRPSGQNKIVNSFMNYLNGSVGTVMFFNMRSALLQQMSLVNYINFADNNVFAAAKAFANQKQYWKDFAFIFNSDMLKQRRGGIQTDVNGAELAESLRNSKNPTRKLISKLLELGFLPTQIGDNIAIATGGSPYYRNRINTYLKQGLSEKEAEAKAFTDFQNLTQSTQQSARPDMVSQQQASVIGKVILNFQNVTSQFNRLGKKAFQDIYNRRITQPNTTQMQSDISNAARITYYFAVQNAIFYTLQTALFAMLFDDDEEDNNKLFLKKKERLINGSIDSVLRGSGVIGAVVSTLKNVAIAFARQRDVNYNPDESAVLMEALNLSPVIGIKGRKITNAEKTLNYNKNIIEEMSTFDIDNPQWSAATNYVEMATNVPLNRLYNKTQNVRQALNNDHSNWERTLMFLGWSQYNLNVENKKMDDVKEKVKTKKKEASKVKREKAKQDKLKEKEAIGVEKQKKEKKEGKKVTCLVCKLPVQKGKKYCTIHEKAEVRKDGKKMQCRKRKSNGKRCGMQTASKSGYCYYHD